MPPEKATHLLLKWVIVTVCPTLVQSIISEQLTALDCSFPSNSTDCVGDSHRARLHSQMEETLFKGKIPKWLSGVGDFYFHTQLVQDPLILISFSLGADLD